MAAGYLNGWIVLTTLGHFTSVESLRTNISIHVPHLNGFWDLDTSVGSIHRNQNGTASSVGGKLNSPEPIQLWNSILEQLGLDGWKVVSVTPLGSSGVGNAETLWTFRWSGVVRSLADEGDEGDPHEDGVHISNY